MTRPGEDQSSRNYDFMCLLGIELSTFHIIIKQWLEQLTSRCFDMDKAKL